jgi:glyoxylase-like metal-dependent hydrolase (beta-lactamase superfamily II)
MTKDLRNAIAQRNPSYPPAPAGAVQLFVLDCGAIRGFTAQEFGFRPGEIATTMSTPCFLVVHPRGVLLWDTGQIPDAERAPGSRSTTSSAFIEGRPLLTQLAELGYATSDITYLALSHYHNDHVANANAFAGSTWIVQRAEYDAMFAAEPDLPRNGPIPPNHALFGELEHSRRIMLDGTNHDVFGDGTVVVMFTPGHTPGHQSLFVQLKETGAVLISGDLYHFPEELNREADFVNHASNARTTQTRIAFEVFARERGAQIWIQHDAARCANLRRPPLCYA